MQTSERLALNDIVLVGGGHSHAVVLQHLGMHPIPGARLTLICRDTHTPYSGMLPGYIAGHYGYDAVHIDLRRLAEFAGARFIHAQAMGLDLNTRQVLCSDRPPVPYDLVSINIGSTPQVAQTPGAEAHSVPVKPIHRFNDHWLTLLEQVRAHTGRIRLAVVGGGAGGVELTLAMQFRLRNELRALGRGPEELDFHLFTATADILPTHNAMVRRSFTQVLKNRGIHLHSHARVEQVSAGRLRTDNGDELDADEIIWVTGAGGAPWLRETGLALDDNGFIQVTDTLQSVSSPTVFAAGDVATMINHPREKAGVFAVRQGRPLADNLRRAAAGLALRPFRPQKHWLALISTGDRYAVASRGAIGFRGAWVWRWKNWIDRRFMARFSK